jgi:hypothetical protein
MLQDGRKAWARAHKRKAVDRMVEIALEKVGPTPAFVGVLHGDAE